MKQSALSPVPPAIKRRFKKAQHVAIFTHQRPDPDALGSQTALAILLNRLGTPHVDVVNFDPPPRIYTFLQEQLPGAGIVSFSPEWAQNAATAYDLFLVTDTCAYQQLEPAIALLKSVRERIVVLDHHLSRDDLSPLILADTDAAAAVEIVWDVARSLKIAMDPLLALPLMAGLVGDTGWFRFDSVTAHTHQVAADLTPHINIAALYERLQQNETPSKLTLTQRALANLTFSAQAKVAVMSLSLSDFTQTQAQQSQTEELVNLALTVGSVEVAALASEMADGRIRVSFRSKHAVDVNQVSRQFGGGGHAKAAGCRVDGPLYVAVQKIRAALEEAVTK